MDVVQFCTAVLEAVTAAMVLAAAMRKKDHDD